MEPNEQFPNSKRSTRQINSSSLHTQEQALNRSASWVRCIVCMASLVLQCGLYSLWSMWSVGPRLFDDFFLLRLYQTTVYKIRRPSGPHNHDSHQATVYNITQTNSDQVGRARSRGALNLPYNYRLTTRDVLELGQFCFPTRISSSLKEVLGMKCLEIREDWGTMISRPNEEFWRRSLISYL